MWVEKTYERSTESRDNIFSSFISKNNFYLERELFNLDKSTFALLLLAQPIPTPLNLAAYAFIGCLHTITFQVNPFKFNFLLALFSFGLRIVCKLDHQVFIYVMLGFCYSIERCLEKMCCPRVSNLWRVSSFFAPHRINTRSTALQQHLI